jgi:hypothetical protein
MILGQRQPMLTQLLISAPLKRSNKTMALNTIVEFGNAFGYRSDITRNAHAVS